HVVGQTHAEPQRRGERQPRHTGLLIGPQRAMKIGARIGGGEPSRPTERLERAREPRTRLDAPPPLPRVQTAPPAAGPPAPATRRAARPRPAAAYLRGTTLRLARPRVARAPSARAPRAAARGPARPTGRAGAPNRTTRPSAPAPRRP